MNYLFFNNTILLSNGINVQHIEETSNAKEIFAAIDRANICVVDVDVLIAACVANPIEKKDSILVRKFKDLYQHENYIIQDEKIDHNLFQVIGIKEQKVREIYSLIPPHKVESFIPYGIALRNTLICRKIDLNKTVVFVDDRGEEKLLTVFDGLMFSRTRVIVNNDEDILPEIKRSQIDFFKKNEEYLNKKSADYLIVVNNQELAVEISKGVEKLSVEYLNVPCPALDGLKEINTSIKYILPEEIIKRRRMFEFKKRITATIISIALLAVGLFYFLFNKVQWGMVANQHYWDKMTHERLDEELALLDREGYRQDLRNHKKLNYGVSYLKLLDLIPASYQVVSFRFVKSDQWHLELTLLMDDGGTFDPIPRLGILKSADIKDIFVNNQPGKHLRVTL